MGTLLDGRPYTDLTIDDVSAAIAAFNESERDSQGGAGGSVGEVTIEGPLEITNDSGNPLPVSGTVTVQDGGSSITVDGEVVVSAATQAGTWTVQPGNTANTTAWLVSSSGATATLAAVSTSTTVATLQASNASRKQVVVVNDSSNVLYIKYGSTATSTDWTVKLVANASLIEDHYTGIITGILDASTGTARVTEVA